jgi:hypothetical protein
MKKWNKSAKSKWRGRKIENLDIANYDSRDETSVYNRGGQSAALQRFSAAPVSNFGYKTKLFMTHLCIKYPKFTSLMWSLCKQNKAKKILQSAIQYFNKIWPVRKKVWPPLVIYNIDKKFLTCQNATNVDI